MKLIGITGGIGTGKTTVAGILQERGWVVYSSDETARMLMQSDAEVRAEMAGLLGPEVLTADGVDKQRVATLVFGTSPEHRERLEALERIVHPRVLEYHMHEIDKHAEAGTPIVAIDSALLFEVGLEDGFDWVIVVDAPNDVRMQRVKERSNLTDEQVQARINEQLPMQEKRALADFVIENGGTIDDLKGAVGKVATIIEVLPAVE
jgi:dephospho-CoA kinase